MVEKGQKLKLGLDLDDTLAETTAHMQQVHEIQYPGIFPADLYQLGYPLGHPDKILQKEFYEAWQAYLRTSWLIPHLPIPENNLLAVQICATVYEIDLITARLENQRDAVEELLRKQNLSREIASICLRTSVEEEMLIVKSKTVKERGTTDAVEDNPLIAVCLAELGIRVAVPDQPWNRWLPNGPNIRKYKHPEDYAYDLILHDGPVNLFAMHGKGLDDPRNLYKIRQVKFTL